MSAEPLHEVRFGDIRASVWTNTGTTGTFYHVTFQRLYLEDGKTKTANGFRTLDLPVLAYTANEAFKWVRAREEDESRARRVKQRMSKTMKSRPAVAGNATAAGGTD